MKSRIFLFFAIVSVTGMLAMSGCHRDDDEQNGRNSRNNRTTGTLSGHDWVDLGLPSGVKWATCNVGATTPEGYGGYYAWGETTTKETYGTWNYRYGLYNSFTKYCNNAEYGVNGFTDTLTILEASDDAATANWGEGWRMPTKEEFKELVDNCTITWTTHNGTYNGKYGILLTGPNGNSIFMPAADRYQEFNSYYYYAAPQVNYWSSSLYYCPTEANVLTSQYPGNNVRMDPYDRCCGKTVRPICNQ